MTMNMSYLGATHYANASSHHNQSCTIFQVSSFTHSKYMMGP